MFGQSRSGTSQAQYISAPGQRAARARSQGISNIASPTGWIWPKADCLLCDSHSSTTDGAISADARHLLWSQTGKGIVRKGTGSDRDSGRQSGIRPEYPQGRIVTRLIEWDAWHARILPGHRWSIAHGYRDQRERRLVADAEWSTVTLRLRGRDLFVVNLRDDRIDVVQFQPGPWETEFGSDPGDDVTPHEPFDLPIGPNADVQAELLAEDAELASLQNGPSIDVSGPGARYQGGFDRCRYPKIGPYTVGLQ